MPAASYFVPILASLLGTNGHPEPYTGHGPSAVISVAEMERWEVYLRFGIIAEEEGQFSRALNRYSAAVKANPSAVPPLLLRGRLYTKFEEYESALKDLDEAVRLEPGRAMTYYMRGNVYFRLRSYHQAVENYTTFLRLNSSGDVYRYDAHKFRGISFYGLTDCVNAKMNLEQALEIDSSDPRGHHYLGLTSYCLGDYEAAASAFRRSLDLDGASETDSYYFAIWLYLAEERARMDGRTGLSERSQAFDLGRWPGPVMEMFLGTVGPEGILAFGVESDYLSEEEILCGKFFYISQFYLLAGDRGTATDFLRQAVATGAATLDEFKAAKTELEKLKRGNRADGLDP